MGGSLSTGKTHGAIAELPTLQFHSFLQMLGSSAISNVVFWPNDTLVIVTKTAERMKTRIVSGLSTEWLVDRLVESKTPFVEGRKAPNLFMKNVGASLVLVLPVLYLYMAYVMLKKVTDDSEQSLVEQRKKRRPRAKAEPISWEHVAGMDKARWELQEVVDFVKSPEKYRRLGAQCPRGILLSGPPGCGKTLLARAAAHEANVNIIVCSASDFVEVFVGRGASRVRDLFRRAEECSPCILFFDELDALAKSRTGGGGGNDEREQTLNQLLTEMDGFDTAAWGGSGGEDSAPNGNGSSSPGGGGRGRIVVIAATNRPEILDSALVRPGRFDRHVRVQLPDEAGRLAILQVHVKRRQVPVDGAVPLERIARKAEGFSGAELGNIVNEACLLSVRSGRGAVTARDFDGALAKVIQQKQGVVSDSDGVDSHLEDFEDCEGEESAAGVEGLD